MEFGVFICGCYTRGDESLLSTAQSVQCAQNVQAKERDIVNARAAATATAKTF